MSWRDGVLNEQPVLAPGTYYYRVEAENDSGSALSNEASATVAAPTRSLRVHGVRLTAPQGLPSWEIPIVRVVDYSVGVSESRTILGTIVKSVASSLGISEGRLAIVGQALRSLRVHGIRLTAPQGTPSGGIPLVRVVNSSVGLSEGRLAILAQAALARIRKVWLSVPSIAPIELSGTALYEMSGSGTLTLVDPEPPPVEALTRVVKCVCLAL